MKNATSRSKENSIQSLFKRLCMTMVVCLICLSPAIYAQAYPDTLWIPVTYYDFHSNGSNPEFQQNHTGGIRKNMVAETLDADRKPVVGSVPYLNHYIKYWYRDWQEEIKGDFSMPDYEITGGQWNASITYKGEKQVNHDTAFINIVIQDSLPFRHIGGGVYEYKDDESANFFPLNGRGFNEGLDGNNYSFTMELHTTFIMKPGITFNFAGDDDVWAFIDNNLEMDLGGIHSMERGSINVDDLGLEPGKEYNFDFFFAERHTSESHIRITTNIVSTKLAKLSLTAEPNDTVAVGDTVTAWAQTVDDTGGIHTGFSDLITWRFIDDGGHDDSALISESNQGISGDTVYFVPTKAHTPVTIEGILLDTNTNEYLRDTLHLYVLPGPPDHLVIEGNSSISGSAYQQAQPISSVTIGPDEIEANAFAVLRDKYGNFVRFSQNTNWRGINNASLLDSIISGDTDIGEGIAYKKGTAGTARISATDQNYSGRSFADSIDVVISQTNYTELRFVINESGSFKPIDNLTISTDQCTLLTVEGYRSDGLRWEPVSGNWSTTLSSTTNPGQAKQSFHFCPTDTGRGSIAVSYQSVNRTLPVHVRSGGPATMKLYDFAGDPSDNSPLNKPPLSYSVGAGDTFTVYAKLFDNNGYWLSEYERTSAPIAWSIVQLNGSDQTGYLTANSGYTTGFSPVRSQRSVYIIGTWGENGRTFSDTVLVKTTHGPAHRLSIQADTSQLSGRDLEQIILSPADTLRHAYAVLRDKFNNYVAPAEFAQWESADSTIAQAKAGALLLGEGLIRRKSDSSTQVNVIATSDGGLFSDTVSVVISQITFTDVEIVIYDGGFQPVDMLSMRTDQDTLLYAIGRRSDDGSWVELSCDWDISGSITTVQSPPPADDKWRFEPLTTGSGRIIITGPNGIADTLTVETSHGPANSLVLYKNAEAPEESAVFPGPGRVDTLRAGKPLQLFANVFDSRNTWLQRYRTHPDDRKITWRVEEESGQTPQSTILSNSQGSQVVFTPTRAYRTMRLIAGLAENNRMFRDTVRIYVAPGAIDHLVIEASSNTRSTSPHQDAPAEIISITPTDTVKSAYAVLRDMYGNFVEFSHETNWYSIDSSVVTAHEAIKEFGEGRIYRNADSGHTRVVARNRHNPYLFDTLKIELLDITYDSLRIVANTHQRIESMEIPVGGEKTLYAEGLRSDGRGWEQIAVDWHASPALRVNNNPPAQKNQWSVNPVRDGTGSIWITRGNSAKDSIDVTFLPGTPTKIVLYEKSGAADITNRPMPDPSSPIRVKAGKPVELYAKIFDENNFRLSPYESADSAQLINWKVVENGNNRTTGILTDSQGHANIFNPRTASQTAMIIVTYKQNFSDTVAISVSPGDPHHVVLEGSQDPKVSPFEDNPIDTIVITEIDTVKHVYAIIRDEFGNFVQHSHITEWMSTSPDLVSAANGNRNIGEGMVRRTGTQGVGVISAASKNIIESSRAFDSVVVKVSAYYYTELRIVDIDGNRVDELTISTNDNAELFVEGKRSTGDWERTAARWTIPESLYVTPAAPENASSWRFSPDKPGSGWISVGLNNDQTQPDTIAVAFHRGKPTSVEYDLLTPSDEIIAGDTLTAVVRIKNNDGLVPGSWCYPGEGNGKARYTDTLGGGNREHLPIIIVNDHSSTLADNGLDTEQCFQNGIDTVRFVLYHAPRSKDSTHVLSVTLDGLIAQTQPFTLIPGEIASLKLVENSAQKTEIPDSLTLRFPDGAVTMMSVGYDAFGNEIGAVRSNWSTSGSLHQINYPENTQQIYYTSAHVTDNESGGISAVYNSKSDSVYVKIVGPGARIIEAVSRDTNGNGYLDAIDIRLDKNVLLPDNFFSTNISNYISVAGNSGYYQLPATGIGGATQGDSTTSFTILLDEASDGEPQTGWEPRLSFMNTGDNLAEVMNHAVRDGASPVIWRVIRKVTDANNRAKDKIMVVFSENIYMHDGTPLSLTTPPEDLFYVWTDSTEQQVQQPQILGGIESFAEGTHGDTAVFYMTNEETVTGYHRFSLKADSTIADDHFNIPDLNNQHVQVVIYGNLGSIKVGPNPMHPVFFKETDRLLARDPQEALGWARNRGGAIFIADFVIPGDPSQPTRNVHDYNIRASMSIYDCIGNRVYERRSEFDFLNEIGNTQWTPGTSRQLTVYWNGITDRNRAAAPGIYRVIMQIEVDGEQVKIAGNLGVGR